MRSRIRSLTVDCADPFALAEFWQRVTGYVGDPDEPNDPGADDAFLRDPAGRSPEVSYVISLASDNWTPTRTMPA